MDINSTKNGLLFALILGFLIYLINSFWAALFIVPLSVSEVGSGDSVANPGYYDTLESLKAAHNQKMLKRNRYWVYTTLIIGGGIGIVMFYLLPKWKGTINQDGRCSAPASLGFMAGVLTVIFVPPIFSLILPPPIQWLPGELREIARLREQEALRVLEIKARNIETKSSSKE